jgi:hypothetical protein
MSQSPRGSGNMKILTYSRSQPAQYNSRIARAATFTTVTRDVWAGTLSPWARARLHAPMLPPDEEDEGAKG